MTAVVRLLRPEPSAPRARPEDARLADAALVAALREGHPGAAAMLFDRHGRHVERLLVRLLGGQDRDLEDLLHEVFVEALENLGRLREPEALRPWLTRIAVMTVRGCLRRRSRGRWLSFFAPSDVPEVASHPPEDDAHERTAGVYRCLDTLHPDLRLAFTLRVLDELTLPETAAACGVSLATAKRRIARGQAAFAAAAQKEPALARALAGGTL